MPVHFRLNVLDLHLVEIELHLLAILWSIVSSHPTLYMLRRYILNLTTKLAGESTSCRPSILTLIAMSFLAPGGSMARKLRAVLPETRLKGEKVVEILVMNFVNIFALIGLSLRRMKRRRVDQRRSRGCVVSVVKCGQTRGCQARSWSEGRRRSLVCVDRVPLSRLGSYCETRCHFSDHSRLLASCLK